MATTARHLRRWGPAADQRNLWKTAEKPWGKLLQTCYDMLCWSVLHGTSRHIWIHWAIILHSSDHCNAIKLSDVSERTGSQAFFSLLKKCPSNCLSLPQQTRRTRRLTKHSGGQSTWPRALGRFWEDSMFETVQRSTMCSGYWMAYRWLTHVYANYNLTTPLIAGVIDACPKSRCFSLMGCTPECFSGLPAETLRERWPAWIPASHLIQSIGRLRVHVASWRFGRPRPAFSLSPKPNTV